MKKVLLLFTVLAVCSCNDDTIIPTEQISPLVRSVNIIDGTIVDHTYEIKNDTTRTLAFRDEAAFETVKRTLLQMNEEDRKNYSSRYGLVNISKIAEIADEELEEIGASCTTMENFVHAYNALKIKYMNILVSNKHDSTDLSLYVPASDDENVYPYITGINHKIVIGNKIIDLQFYDRVNKSDSINFIHTDSHKSGMRRSRATDNEMNWDINSFVEQDNGKKVSFSASIEGDHIKFHFGAQKKMWYGWKRDNYRELYFRLYDLNGMTFDRTGAGLFEMENPDKTYWLGPNGQFGSINLNVGRWTVQPAPSIYSCNVTGKIYVWTDMTVDKNANGNVIHYMAPLPTLDPSTGEPAYVETNYPSLSNNKAYVCKLALTKLR